MEAQSAQDTAFIRAIYSQAMAQGQSYPWLRSLCKDIGHRISGSPQAEKAVAWGRSVMDTLRLDRVELQACMVPRWVRGKAETVQILDKTGKAMHRCEALALGESVATPPAGLRAAVVEVHSLEELRKMGREAIAGKIVFFNRPMDRSYYYTMEAYRDAVDQRSRGPAAAAELGALAVLVRSMTTEIDHEPHTGNTHFGEGVKPIPAFAISTADAVQLAAAIRKGNVSVFCQSDSYRAADVLSHNVIGEIRGSEKPEEIILVGGHLDSWDVGEGAHDDGAGCVQSLDVLYLLKKMGYKPKRTIRCVLFMNEENGLKGGLAYADSSNARKEFHLAAIEADRGGFSPRGFTIEGMDTLAVYRPALDRIRKSLEPYALSLREGGSGADIGPLRSQGGLMIGYEPDNQRYFDFHHTHADVLEAVNPRELQLGAASMAALVYLLDQYGR